MKQFLLAFLLVVSFSSKIYSQTPSDIQKSHTLDRQFYLQKSKQQKKLATIFVITGGVFAAVGGYLWFLSPLAGLSESGNVEGAARTGKTLLALGGTFTAVSIPLFIAGKKNKEKASLNIGMGKIYTPKKIEHFTVSVRLPLH